MKCRALTEVPDLIQSLTLNSRKLKWNYTICFEFMADCIIRINDNICLKSPKPQNAPELFEIFQKECNNVGEWIRWLKRMTTLKHVQDYIYNAIRLNNGVQNFTTLILDNESIIEAVSLTQIDRLNQRTDLGFWLVQDQQ